MTNSLFKFSIGAAPTVNQAATLEIIPDSKKGNMFRIEGGHIAVPDLDAIAATDQIQFQIATQDQNDAAALYDIASQYEVYTECYDFHLAEAAITQLDDPTKKLELRKIEGTLLESGKRYYLTSLITGQDGAIGMKVCLFGHYVATEVDDWHNSKF